MRTDYAEVSRSTEAVERFEASRYAPHDHRAALDVRQRTFLRHLVRRAFPERRPVQHDFACGTGRAIRLLHGVVRSAHGYDTSRALLRQAREAGVYAKLHQVPADGPVPAPANLEGPKLVTVFGALLDAGPEVCERAVTFAAGALPHWDAGLLIIEHHAARVAPGPTDPRRPGMLRWPRVRRRPGSAEVSHDEVTALLRRHGFDVVERRGLAICPPAAYRRSWSRPIAGRLDDLAARIPALSALATDVLYVARRVRG